MARIAAAERERLSRCRYPGCLLPWFTTFSAIGPVCQKHIPGAPPPSPKFPITAPAKPWSEHDKDEDAEEV